MEEDTSDEQNKKYDAGPAGSRGTTQRARASVWVSASNKPAPEALTSWWVPRIVIPGLSTVHSEKKSLAPTANLPMQVFHNCTEGCPARLKLL